MAYLSCRLLRGVTSEVNLRNLLRGSSEACEGSTLALKPCADVTRRLKQGYQWSHKRINVLQNILKKKRKLGSEAGGPQIVSCAVILLCLKHIPLHEFEKV